MSSWRDAILADFIPNISKLTLVADPDGLLTEEKLALELRKRGFELIEFNDSIAFRYAYESQYRSVWDKGDHTDLVVVLRLQDAELEYLPFDLLQAGRKLSFNLGDLFPNLSYAAIENLDRCWLDALYDAQQKTLPERMGNNATKDFILRHVFGIAAEMITNDVELFRALLRMHYGKLQIPSMLTDRLIQVFKSYASFSAWPLAQIVQDEEAFFEFLQERWPIFVSGLNSSEQIKELPPEQGLKYSGPDYLPFDHQDIRVYIDNLFLEGKLTPIEALNLTVDQGSWIRSGIAISAEGDEELRITRLFGTIANELPAAEARHSAWIAFALKWAELSCLVHCSNSADHQARLREIGDAMNRAFAIWMDAHYSSLINLSPNTPAMLHHVPRRMARDMVDSPSHRTALIVVDGLALDQWVTVRQFLQKQDADLVMRESATFAWVPTLTSVSRQSIFAGKPPLLFPRSINSTNSEEKLWKQFWEGYNISRLDVAYQRGLGQGNPSSVFDGAIHPTKTRVVGLVVDTVDKVMHGMQLGSAGMHNQIKQWCESGYLADLIGQLLDLGYDVWLTADHGNIECDGKGRPAEGVIAETRGERVRVYPTPELRSQVAKAFPFSHEWEPIGLPESYFPLVAHSHDAFVSIGEAIVGHGGVSVEEVIVPLVKFERKKNE